MRATEIREGIYWVGAIDWHIRNFHGYTTNRGATYNAYLILDEKVTLIDTGEEAAWELKRTLKAKDLLADRAQEGTTTLYASDQPEDFGSMAKHFLQEELTSPVLQVNIDRY